jgi:hypothetical protein
MKHAETMHAFSQCLGNELERTTRTFSPYWTASSSTRGAIIRHGPHQGAQKSTSTGTADSRTSLSQLSSVTAPTAEHIHPPQRHITYITGHVLPVPGIQNRKFPRQCRYFLKNPTSQEHNQVIAERKARLRPKGPPKNKIRASGIETHNSQGDSNLTEMRSTGTSTQYHKQTRCEQNNLESQCTERAGQPHLERRRFLQREPAADAGSALKI